MDKFEILVCGVGGQGVLLTSHILDRAARLSGYKKVIGSEVHGLAQRGGSLASHTRFGENIYGPIIASGDADVIISLEMTEGIRHLDRLSRIGHMIIAETRMPTAAMWSAGMQYPKKEDVRSCLLRVTDNVTILDTQKIASRAGNKLSANVVALGATAAAVADFPIATENMKKAIEIIFKDRDRVNVNLKAFEDGMAAVKPATSSVFCDV